MTNLPQLLRRYAVWQARAARKTRSPWLSRLSVWRGDAPGGRPANLHAGALPGTRHLLDLQPGVQHRQELGVRGLHAVAGQFMIADASWVEQMLLVGAGKM